MLKILQQNVDILAGGDAGEQNNFAFRASLRLRRHPARAPGNVDAFMNALDFARDRADRKPLWSQHRPNRASAWITSTPPPPCAAGCAVGKFAANKVR
jgi:hypothetical protein